MRVRGELMKKSSAGAKTLIAVAAPLAQLYPTRQPILAASISFQPRRQVSFLVPSNAIHRLWLWEPHEVVCRRVHNIVALPLAGQQRTARRN